MEYSYYLISLLVDQAYTYIYLYILELLMRVELVTNTRVNRLSDVCLIYKTLLLERAMVIRYFVNLKGQGDRKKIAKGN